MFGGRLVTDMLVGETDSQHAQNVFLGIVERQSLAQYCSQITASRNSQPWLCAAEHDVVEDAIILVME
jgi:hypothetical protein